MSTIWEQNLKKYWIDYAKLQSGRDKMYRLLQYTSKMVHFQLGQSGAPKETVAWVKHISKTLSNGRKFFRLGKFIDNWYKAYQHIQKNGLSCVSEVDIIRLLTCGAYISDMIFYIYDALAWIEAAKIGKFPSYNVKFNRNRWNAFRYTLKFTAGLMWLRHVQAGTAEYYKHRRTAVKSFLDVCNPLKSLGYNSLNDGQIGMLGTVTSLIGMYDDLFAKKKKTKKH